ncbi:N-succinyl-L,L-diaminopimelate aminotransferase alternative [plant metagenome]|uniref:N-succinyl-L,L-diaminopimelate aminotransferase alternative n=2 Tax=root TaxID=1 RepID=A0A1C3K1L2_9BURK|nr:succinyldiaminopimelate transaminase [Orrella dioscoreae]SBT25298.1 N-succinyl-L,L-diaminopimelate aminotransferase alternative [Orrella dioscoreae]SOE49072.1 N-succinyl-L,L-diaminopimelate aminotransferase alternative [Orrella dioscoreae]
MNPRLDALQPYPFEKLRALMAEAGTPPEGLRPIGLQIGEPKHAAPQRVKDALSASLDGLSVYPPTKGDPALRTAISQWISRRYDLPAPDAETQVLPVLGSREALFAFAQVVIDPSRPARVVCPNPFYQIYEGAALLAGAQPYFVNADPARDFGCNWDRVPAEVWAQTQLLFVCSPGNPAGNVMSLDEWRTLFELADRHGFVIAADECYSEIYLDEDAPPLGALQAARRLGRNDYRGLVCFSSLSKRSNVPGLRSGFVAGDAALIARFLLYRTYHGSAMSPIVTAASIAAWNDEGHVEDNRAQYRAKFDAVLPVLEPVLDVRRPQASFYLWAGTHGSDTIFTRDLYAQTGVTVLPGSLLAREAHGANPGAGRIRIALVAPLADCLEAAHRIADFARRRR